MSNNLNWFWSRIKLKLIFLLSTSDVEENYTAHKNTNKILNQFQFFFSTKSLIHVRLIQRSCKVKQKKEKPKRIVQKITNYKFGCCSKKKILYMKNRNI